MKINDKTKERINKIIQLATRGIGGEKETAKKMLEDFFEKTGMTLSDFEDEIVTRFEIKFKDKLEKALVFQLLSKIIDTSPVSYIKRKWYTKTIWVKITKSQQIEFDFLFHLYRIELQKELEITLHAFVQKNNIFCGSAESTNENVDHEWLQKIFARTNSIDKLMVNKALEG